MTTATNARTLRVEAVRFEADDILSFELVDPDQAELDPFGAGSHVDLVLPNGLTRSYSLASSQSDRGRYVLGVHRTPDSRGGSSWIHDNLRPGMLVQVSTPLNNFELDESAETSILIAGGIGITPILAMAHRLEELQKKWHLYYAVRERALMAFTRELAELASGTAGEVTLHIDAEEGGVLDLTAIARTAGGDTQIYCCGPAPMLAAFETATSALPPASVHVEHFSSDVEANTSGGFEIVLKRSNLTLPVEPGKTILTTMLDAGVDVPFSCSEGICGTCETRVLEGIPDHRDLVLTESEKAANDVVFVCCSGSRSPRLVLDA